MQRISSASIGENGITHQKSWIARARERWWRKRAAAMAMKEGTEKTKWFNRNRMFVVRVTYALICFSGVLHPSHIHLWRASVEQKHKVKCVVFGAIIKIMIFVRLECRMFVLAHALPFHIQLATNFLPLSLPHARLARASAAHVIDTFNVRLPVFSPFIPSISFLLLSDSSRFSHWFFAIANLCAIHDGAIAHTNSLKHRKWAGKWHNIYSELPYVHQSTMGKLNYFSVIICLNFLTSFSFAFSESQQFSWRCTFNDSIRRLGVRALFFGLWAKMSHARQRFKLRHLCERCGACLLIQRAKNTQNQRRKTKTTLELRTTK